MMETASRYNTPPYVNSLQRWKQRRSGTSVRRQSKPPPHWHFGPLSGEKAIPTQDSGGRTAALVQHQCGYCEYAAGTVARRRGHPFVCQWWWSGTTPERGCPCTAAGASGTRAQPLVMDAMSAITRAWARATGRISHWLPAEGALPCSVCAWQPSALVSAPARPGHHTSLCGCGRQLALQDTRLPRNRSSLRLSDLKLRGPSAPARAPRIRRWPGHACLPTVQFLLFLPVRSHLLLCSL